MEGSNTYLRTAEAARYCGVSPRTLEKWRVVGGGPYFIRPPGRRLVRYAKADLDAWLVAGRRRSTSEGPSDPVGGDPR